jgi:hypothetical protein
MRTVEDHSGERVPWLADHTVFTLAVRDRDRVTQARERIMSPRQRRLHRSLPILIHVAGFVPIAGAFALRGMFGSGWIAWTAAIVLGIILCVLVLSAAARIVQPKILPLERDVLLELGLCGACGQSLDGLRAERCGLIRCPECAAYWRPPAQSSDDERPIESEAPISTPSPHP